MNWRVLTATALSVGLSACISVRDYDGPPADPIDDGAVFARADTDRYAAEEPVIEWWRELGEDDLNTLIAETFANNLNRAEAEANLRASRAVLRLQKRNFLPNGDFSASAQRQGISENAQAFPGFGSIPDFDLYDVGFDAAWEIDLFGRLAGQRDAAAADLQADIATRDDLLVSLAAETASTYVTLRGAQEQLAVAERNAENQRATYDLTEVLREGGRGTKLDTERARAQLDLTLATIPPLRALIDQSIFRLSVLTGRQPTALLNQLIESEDLPSMPALVAVGDASKLLRRRPDIRRAERELASASELVGVAAADFFPTVSITGSVGLSAQSVGDLPESNSLAFGVGPQLIWNILDFGRIRARVDQADELSVAAAARYQQTVLLALEETESALSSYTNELEREVLLRDSAEASQEAARLARLRYQNGVDDFLQVLDSERVALENETQHVVSRTQTFISLIAIYKALGGGWQTAGPMNESAVPAGMRERNEDSAADLDE
ncbi:efflux transporter outer membrane subunit [Erythrobacter rubeus]|uniref:Efflux transporter outer membrane subunit n=1 Tax=Erythrobacter rubeus TaxID=2760803 RepID=A0ABR8KXD6_9SPHN|nr:efflux transporter outer membrane subunit [Erythrobacter rubeus]MBD2842876.1 efflux transporter outer membrane subunit [Erythrobacter rubeus]